MDTYVHEHTVANENSVKTENYDKVWGDKVSPNSVLRINEMWILSDRQLFQFSVVNVSFCSRTSLRSLKWEIGYSISGTSPIWIKRAIEFECTIEKMIKIDKNAVIFTTHRLSDETVLS